MVAFRSNLSAAFLATNQKRFIIFLALGEIENSSFFFLGLYFTDKPSPFSSSFERIHAKIAESLSSFRSILKQRMS
jgi:hypothetical protein